MCLQLIHPGSGIWVMYSRRKARGEWQGWGSQGGPINWFAETQLAELGKTEGVAINRDGISKWILPSRSLSPPPKYWSKRKCKTGSTNPAPLIPPVSHLHSPMSHSPTFLFVSSPSFIGSSVLSAFGHQQTQRYICNPNISCIRLCHLDNLFWLVLSLILILFCIYISRIHCGVHLSHF